MGGSTTGVVEQGNMSMNYLGYSIRIFIYSNLKKRIFSERDKI